MTLNYVTLVLDLDDGQGNLITKGSAAFTPSVQLTDAGVALTTQAPVPAVFHAAGPPSVKLLPTDASGPLPAGWVWTVSFSGVPGNPAGFSFPLPYTSGSTQYLSAQVEVAASGSFSSFLPVPVLVPAPTGATATDTAAVQGAISKLAAAGGKGTLWFQDGTYQVDGNALVIRSCSDFTVASLGATFITQAPNTASKPNNTTGNLLTIADCTDFRVEGLTLDGLRDTVAPLTPLTASASSGQPSVTVASGQGSRYQAGQYVNVYGGLGSAEQAQADNWTGSGGGTSLVVQSITPGGGSGGGDLITFTTNLANSYAQISSTAFSDSYGPYAYAGAYLTPYQTGRSNSVAGRTLGGEDQQNGLHLLSCSRFDVAGVTARNVWESPIKMGTGFATTSLTDGCTDGTITDCTVYHGYDQGVSAWVCRNVTIKGCVADSPGWAGISLTGSDYCVVTGNQLLNSVYRVPTNTQAGMGIAIEGGLRNQVKGNIVTSPYYYGIIARQSPLFWGLPTPSNPTITNFLEAATAAGTSILVSSTSGMVAGGLYSILDGPRSEAVTVASIVDGTHVTFSQRISFSHAAGSYLTVRIAQENVIEGNTVRSSGNSGIAAPETCRTVIKNNVVTGYGTLTGLADRGIDLNTQNISMPSGQTLGGDGAHVEGNVIGNGGNASGGGAAIYASGITRLQIHGNRIYSPNGSGGGIELHGVTDSTVTANQVTDVIGSYGIVLENNSATPCARVTVTGNVVQRTSSHEGISVQNGDSLTITGNEVSSCAGTAGINLLGLTNSAVTGNVSNSNLGAGIHLGDNGSVHSQYNRVTGNTCRDDGSGYNVATGGSWTQQHGIVEDGSSNGNLFTGNECDSNAIDQLTTVGAASYAWANTLSGAASGNFPAALLPAGTTSVQGALQLDGTAADIQPAGVQAAGNSGLAADAKHVHFSSGQYLCAPVSYAPGSQTLLTVNTTTLAAFSSGNACTGSFTAPASGDVVVHVSCAALSTGAGTLIEFGLAAAGTVTPQFGKSFTVQVPAASSLLPVSFDVYVTGLTPGSPYQFDLLGAANSGQSASVYANGVSTVTSKGAPVLMTVQAV